MISNLLLVLLQSMDWLALINHSERGAVNDILNKAAHIPGIGKTLNQIGEISYASD